MAAEFYPEIFKLIDERLKANEEEIIYLSHSLEALQNDLKKKEDLIRNLHLVIDGLRVNANAAHTEASK